MFTTIMLLVHLGASHASLASFCKQPLDWQVATGVFEQCAGNKPQDILIEARRIQAKLKARRRLSDEAEGEKPHSELKDPCSHGEGHGDEDGHGAGGKSDHDAAESESHGEEDDEESHELKPVEEAAEEVHHGLEKDSGSQTKETKTHKKEDEHHDGEHAHHECHHKHAAHAHDHAEEAAEEAEEFEQQDGEIQSAEAVCSAFSTRTRAAVRQNRRSLYIMRQRRMYNSFSPSPAPIFIAEFGNFKVSSSMRIAGFTPETFPSNVFKRALAKQVAVQVRAIRIRKLVSVYMHRHLDEGTSVGAGVGAGEGAGADGVLGVEAYFDVLCEAEADGAVIADGLGGGEGQFPVAQFSESFVQMLRADGVQIPENLSIQPPAVPVVVATGSASTPSDVQNSDSGSGLVGSTALLAIAAAAGLIIVAACVLLAKRKQRRSKAKGGALHPARLQALHNLHVSASADDGGDGAGIRDLGFTGGGTLVGRSSGAGGGAGGTGVSLSLVGMEGLNPMFAHADTSRSRHETASSSPATSADSLSANSRTSTRAEAAEAAEAVVAIAHHTSQSADV